MTTYQKGDAFESYVASLYEGLGCKVERNLLLSGQQVDMLVRRTFPGMGTITSIVECKYLSKTAVSNQHIYDFNNFFLSCKERHRLNNAVVVTNTRFSKEAKSFAHDHPFLLLKTSHDLEKEILDVSEVLLLETRQYRESAIFDTFIHLDGQGRLFPRQRIYSISDVYAAICAWLLGNDPGFVTLLGDFGSGKTTILERVNFFCSEQYLQNNSFYLPVLFKLRNFRYHRTLAEFISQTIITHFNQPLPTKLFFEYLRNRKFLILLDGFDEISTVADKQTRANYFYDLLPLYGSASPAIMTCRPTYFVSPKELTRLLQRLAAKDKSFARTEILTDIYSKLHDKYTGHSPPSDINPRNFGATISLQTLSDANIDEYLQKHGAAFNSNLNTSWESVRDFLFKIYDIHDLMKRPILLSMIVDTVLEGEMDIEADKIKHGPASLYELYTNLNFDRDWKKGSSTAYFTPQERRKFAHYIALAMMRSPTLEVSSDDINSMLQGMGTPDGIESLGRFSVEQGATDLRVCSFLRVSPGNTFRFTHRSFMEFFVAQYIALELLRGKVPAILGESLSNEIVYFLGNLCLCNNYKELATSIERIRSKREYDGQFHENVRSNLGGAILQADDLCVGAAFFRTRWNECAFKKLKWREHSFVDCNFYKSSFECMEITGATFRNVLQEAAEFKDCSMQGKWNGKVYNSSFKRVHFSNAEVHWDVDKTSMLECTFNQCRIYVAGSINVVSSKVESTSVLFEQWKRTRVLFDRCEIRNSEICVEELGTGVEFNFEEVRWEASKMYGVFVPNEKLRNIIDHRALRGCEGLILTNEGIEEITDKDGIMMVGGVFVMLQKVMMDRKEMVNYINRMRNRGAGANIINKLEWWSRGCPGGC